MCSFALAEDVLKAIGEETRLKIIAFLTMDTFCVCELVELLGMSQPSISQHIRKLKQVDLILEDKRGKWNFYSLNRYHPYYPLLLHLMNTLPSVATQVKELEINRKRIVCK
ncbi:ArsR/SmtB family transcription factor [Virgibacillus sp. W0430]|uniref:ArsR/SmtB family transcription factor n=1 Tax=Virgibacillus sp. W0430 TaxID=3391580 RepID=UPI003F46B0E7